MLFGEISTDVPRARLPVQSAPPTLRQQIDLSRLESGSDRYPRETSLQPKPLERMKNQRSAVKSPIRTVSKSNDPAPTPNKKPACNSHSTFIIDGKDLCLWPLADPQGFFIEAKTVCKIASKLKIKSLPRAQSAIPGCIAEIACVRLQSVQGVSLMGGRERRQVLPQIVPVLLKAKAVGVASKRLFHFAARIVFLFLK